MLFTSLACAGCCGQTHVPLNSDVEAHTPMRGSLEVGPFGRWLGEMRSWEWGPMMGFVSLKEKIPDSLFSLSPFRRRTQGGETQEEGSHQNPSGLATGSRTSSLPESGEGTFLLFKSFYGILLSELTE